MAAQSVKQAECAFGVLYRRLRARLGPAQATVATAHAIARVVYRMLKYKVEYDPLSVNEYQKQYEEQQIKYMKKRAAKLGYQLLPVPAWKGQGKREGLTWRASLICVSLWAKIFPILFHFPPYTHFYPKIGSLDAQNIAPAGESDGLVSEKRCVRCGFV